MARPPISDDVRDLVVALGSMEAIEALLLLAREPRRAYAANDLGTELHVSRDVEPVLEHLASLNLLDVRIGARITYRFAPGSPDLGRTVEGLSRDYASMRLAVLELLQPPSSIRAFADAFRMRKKKRTDG